MKLRSLFLALTLCISLGSSTDVMMTESEDEGDSIDYVSKDEGVDNEFSLYPSQVPNSGVRIEEIVDEEKPASENDQSKHSEKKRSRLGTFNENENNRQMVVKSGTGVPVLESEDEDGFPTFPQKNKSDTLKSVPKVEERDNESISLKKLKKKEKDTFDREKLKRNAVSQDVEPTRNNNERHDLSVQPDTATPVNETKQKKNKKKKVAEKEENARESGMSNSNSTGEFPVAMNDLKQTADKKKEKKNKKQNKQQESAAIPNTEEKLADKKVSSMEKKEKPKAKSLQVRTFSNGLVIEELVMGKPDGKRASPGKKVTVRYIGKLKKNDKFFDSNIGKAPFKFRLGIGEVIKGWDVGVNGMRIGDKRRLTIPPAMGYGAKGYPPAIPQNSWLVFDVELVDVN